MARRILAEELRLDVLEKEGGLELFSAIQAPGTNAAGSRTLERYYVRGHRMVPRQSLVRVFRRSSSEIETNLEKQPVDPTSQAFPGVPGLERDRQVRGIRDAAIENRLRERLELVPSLEVVSGNAPVPMRSVLMEDSGEPRRLRAYGKDVAVVAIDTTRRFDVWERIECDVFAISPTLEARQADAMEPGVQLSTEAREDGFHGRLFLGTLSASPPALQAPRHFEAVPPPKE
ncbi:hypothetical protein LY474_30790 [Myxococcus stipitatus]|uniref:hypothetical protein n=1 Tax=Myxococcus stipitatus TaxID=83455 RepID=UPI001F39D0BF|nr:hypothetical protein [Myxococcus stipitatus]MCE9672201.1 hypothetical protein [Myxococcus stipitatus]